MMPRTLKDVLETFCVGADRPMHEVLQAINANGAGLAMVVDGDTRLLGLVTDGDVRRALLAGKSFDLSAGDFLASESAKPVARMVTGTAGTELPDAMRRMAEHGVRHLPLVDGEGRIAGLYLQTDSVADGPLPLHAVVMAGGFGTRLRPLTDDVPKPLLPVGNKPVMQYTVEKLRDSGVRRVSVTTHYHAEQIREYFGDGSAFGVDVEYAHEGEPLGTAGALSMLREKNDPLLVINGDILTGVDFRSMHDFHKEHDADVTIGVRKYEVSVPFGVVEGTEWQVERLVEKPSLSFFINTGIYLLEPKVVDYVKDDERMDMPDLIQLLMKDGGRVASFPVHEYWLDIGQLQDYMRAQADADSGRLGK